MKLYRIAYVSTSLLAGTPREREEIAAILLASRRNNEEAEITGALLATDQRFAQVFEGPRGAVAATYRRITRDPRHTELMQLLSDTIPRRQFKAWSMAYIGPSQSAEEAVGRVTRDLSRSNADQVARGLVSFMSRMIEAETPARTSAAVPQ